VARTPSAEYLILDIETVPDSERWQPDPPPAPPAPPPPVGAGGAPPPDPGASAAPPPPRAERTDRPKFPPSWAHRIVVIGCMWLDHGYRLKKAGVIGDPGLSRANPGPESPNADHRERILLEDFSALVGKARPVLVTYNGRSFDLPVIALRSLCHGISLGWYYREKNVRYRYSEEGHLDLCDWLADHGATRSGSLDALTRLIGLPGKVGVDGSQVEPLYRAGELAAIQRYCLQDVTQTALLFLRFRLLQGMLAYDQYQLATRELLAGLASDARVSDVLAGIDRTHLIDPASAA
jgi:3'-5' exonuclease